MTSTVITILYLFVSTTAEIIDCTEEDCKEQEIICEELDEPCTINCLDEYACFASNIQCNADTVCNINCNDKYSCLKSKIKCPLNSDCFVNGLELNSLSESVIQCPITNTTKCMVNCNSSLSCHNTLIDGQYTDKLSLHCNDINSCMDFSVYCPEYNLTNNQPNCIIAGEDASDHTNLQLFAINGFKDIDATQYITNVGGESVLFCGVDHTETCIIDNSTFNCINTSSPCSSHTVYTTISPTMLPTALPSSMPTGYPSYLPTVYPTNLPTMDPTDIPTMYPSILPTIQPSSAIIPTKSIKTTTQIEEHVVLYNAPKLIFDGEDAIYLVIFGGIMFIALLVVSVCVYLNCKCYKPKIEWKKRRYGNVIDVDNI